MWKTAIDIANYFGLERSAVSRIAKRVHLTAEKIGGKVTLYNLEEWQAYELLKELGFKKGDALEFISTCPKCKHLRAKYNGQVCCTHCK